MRVLHDFHIHTTLSKCAKETATVENYLQIAKELGLRKIGFANHFWDESIEGANGFYKPQNYEHLVRLLPELEKIDSKLQVYFGCETEYDPLRHDVAITEEKAERFDYILVPNSHTHMTMAKNDYTPYQKHVEFMINAYKEIIHSKVSRYITAIAHPFEAVACPYDNSILIKMISDDDFKRLFDKTAAKEIAIEINMSSMRSKTNDEIEACAQMRMFRIARDCGCKFLFGSDAHDNNGHSSYANADFVAELLELKETQLADIAR